MDIYIDIETNPGQKPWVREHIAQSVTPPGNMKKAETIEAWETDGRKDAAIDEAWAKTALDATLGEINTICWKNAGWTNEKGDMQVFSRDPLHPDADPADEKTLISSFFDHLGESLIHYPNSGAGQPQTPKFIGHHVTFDLGFLWRRAVILGVTPPFRIPYDAKPWSKEIVDTCQLWNAGDRSTSSSLDVICQAMGIGGKAMSGAEVWPAIQAGQMDRVVEHCQDDVRKLIEVHQRMEFRGAAQ